MAKRVWKFEEVKPNVHLIRMPYPKHEQFVLLLADIHWDNPKCKRELLKRHLDQAIERDAPIVIVGDFFCAMQGKGDPRSGKGDIRPEHMRGDYLDSLVSTAADYLEPYSKNIVVIGYGNHETAIQERHETDLLGNLCYELRKRGGITRTGGYDGWLRFMFSRSTARTSRTLYYHHGFGGGGGTNHGHNHFAHMMMQVRADIIVSGHVHQHEQANTIIATLSESGTIQRVPVNWVRCSTYKDEYTDAIAGFHKKKGSGARPLGGWWLRWFKGGDSTTPDRQLIATEGY